MLKTAAHTRTNLNAKVNMSYTMTLNKEVKVRITGDVYNSAYAYLVKSVLTNMNQYKI